MSGQGGSRRRGRDGRAIPTVDLTSEYEEVRRRAYHQRIRQDLVDRGAILEPVERALEQAAPRLRQMGWRVTETREQAGEDRLELTT
jgi:hypothetical protein